MPELPPEVAAAPPDARFGRFVRVRRLGSGGMGEVWQAWDTELARWVAVKFLRVSGDESELARFQREARVAARLSHPNIAAVYDVGEDRGRHWIAMQLVAGRTLHAFPRKDLRLTVRLIRDAARAVDHAHRDGIIHRDLKPENIMLEDGGAAGPRVYVMDFGLARPAEGATVLSSTGTVVGTPPYMSPEQARGDPLDARSDVWSLGATLYDLLTGRPPFSGRTAMDTLMRVVNDDPKRPRRVNPAIEPDLETIVLRCLEKNPARRYATAAALADDLDRWLASESIAARPISRVEFLLRTLRRRKALTALAAVTVAALVVVAVLMRGASAERERMRRLSDLWMSLVEKKRDLRSQTVPPAAATDALKRAVAAVDAFVAEHPSFPQGWYLRARGALYLSDHDRAEAHAAKALELAPDFHQARRLLALIRLERAQAEAIGFRDDDRQTRVAALVEQAARDLAAAGSARDDPWGLTATAEEDVLEVVSSALHRAYVKGDVEGAAADLERASESRRAEEYAIWYAILRPSPVDHWRRVVEWAPGFAWGWFALGCARHQARDFAGARTAYDRALAIHGDYADVLNNRGTLRLEEGDAAGALADYDDALKARPGQAVYYSNRGRARRKSGDPAGAVADHDRAIALRPDYTEAWFNRGSAREELHDIDGALADYGRAIELGSVDAHYNRGVLRIDRGEIDGAIDDFETFLRRNSRHAAALVNRAIARHRRRDLSGARADFDAAIEADARNEKAYHNRAILRIEQGDVDGAIADYDRCLELAKNPHAYCDRGTLRLKRGQVDLAIADLDAAIAAKPDYAEAYNNRGIAKRMRNDLAGALADYNRAITLKVDYADAYENRGIVRGARGEYDAAIEDFDRAIAIRPESPGPYHNRAVARKRTGDLRRAVADWEAALQRAPPDWPPRAEAERALAEARKRLNP